MEDSSEITGIKHCDFGFIQIECESSSFLTDESIKILRDHALSKEAVGFLNDGLPTRNDSIVVIYLK